MNTFSLEEKQSDKNYSRKLNLAFTDTAIDKVASVMGDHLPLTPSINPKEALIRKQQPTLSAFQKSAQETRHNQDEMSQGEIIDTTSQNISEANSPSYYFEKDGQGFLVSKNPDYKGKNKKLQQQRFNLLYVWAYNLLYQEPVPNKEHINQAAKNNGIYDNNYPTYFNDVSNRFFIKIEGAFKLNPAGQIEVNKILLEMQDSDLKGAEYWSLSRKNSSKGSRMTKENAQKIEAWIHKQSRFDKFDIRTLNTTVELAILTLYDITKELKVQDAVKPSIAYEYLIKRYKTVSKNKKNFSDTLCNKSNEKYFGCTSEGQYYLTSEAEKLAESWLSKT